MATKDTTRVYKGAWEGEKFVLRYADGEVQYFDPRRVNTRIQDEARRYGFSVRLQRFHAVPIEVFPKAPERMREGRRRMLEWVEHVYSGSDQWDMPKSGTRGPTEEDCLESLERAYPGKGRQAFARKREELRQTSGELAGPEAIKFWFATRQVAAAWVEIQAERRASQTTSLDDADGEVDRLIG